MDSASGRIQLWRHEPVTFVHQVLQAEPDAWQVEVLTAALTNMRLCLKASKGPGKSTVLAWLGWWFLTTRPHPKVVATSITGSNLKDNLWTELAKWQGRSPFLRHAFKWSAERIVAKDHPETWWASARTWSKDADSARQADTLAGLHGDHMLFLVDEAGGIPDAVVAAAEGGLANADPARGTEALLVLAGNPTDLSGPLYRACTRERGLWWVKEISGDPDDPNRAPRVSIQWAREQIEKYGRDSPWVLVNVFGQFPPGQSNTLIGVEDASQASRRTMALEDFMREPKVLGVDVARFGDDRTVFQARQGRVAFKQRIFRNLDTMETADRVALSISRWHPDYVFVDQTGVGSGVVDRLRQLGHPVIGIDNAGRALLAEPKMHNRRSEQWWLMSLWLKAGGCIPDDNELIQELTTPTYKFNGGNELVLEPKPDIKKRLGFSPDKADALALTFAVPVAPKVDELGQPKKASRVSDLGDQDPYGAPSSGGHQPNVDPYGGL